MFSETRASFVKQTVVLLRETIALLALSLDISVIEDVCVQDVSRIKRVRYRSKTWLAEILSQLQINVPEKDITQVPSV